MADYFIISMNAEIDTYCRQIMVTGKGAEYLSASSVSDRDGRERFDPDGIEHRAEVLMKILI